MSNLNKTINDLLKDEKQLDLVIKNAFNTYDKNKNGLLDIDEVESILISFSKQNNIPNPTRKECEALFTSLDLNKDGKIDYKEFKIFFTQFLKNSK
jgi:Ca2+-binding EF-hand superfamily protein